MTTAHRPTWKAAYGLADSIGKGYTPTRSYSARVIFHVNVGPSRLLKTQIETMGSRLSRLAQITRFQILADEKITIG